MSNSPKKYAAPHGTKMASDLVPEDGSEKVAGLNAYYRQIAQGMQAMFNSTGPKLAALHKLDAREARGIFISCHQQMLCAVTAMQFGLRPDQQHWLEDRILAVIKSSVNFTPLVLPPHAETPLSPPIILAEGCHIVEDETLYDPETGARYDTEVRPLENPVTPIPQDVDEDYSDPMDALNAEGRSFVDTTEDDGGL